MHIFLDAVVAECLGRICICNWIQILFFHASPSVIFPGINAIVEESRLRQPANALTRHPRLPGLFPRDDKECSAGT